MSLARRLSSRLLNAAARHASSDTQDWAHAMLRELDYIEGDWAALFWAVGGTTAIFRYSVPREVRAWAQRRRPNRAEELMMNTIGQKATGVISGVGMAFAVVACAFGFVRLFFLLFPAWDIERMPWAEWLGVIVVPETIFIVTSVAVWRRRRSMAVGIVLSAITLITHFVIHVAAHG
jgi:hypothetical protein